MIEFTCSHFYTCQKVQQCLPHSQHTHPPPPLLFTCPNQKNIGEKNKININSVHIFLFGPRIIPISCSFHELYFHFPFISMYLLDLPNVVGIIICNCHCVIAEYFIPFVVLERNKQYQVIKCTCFLETFQRSQI